jgi:hydrogenase nickel incorporation protein HypA/HybF
VHEIGILQDIMEIVEARTGGAPVKRLVLEVGKLTCVLPDALRFCFDIATEGTLMEGAELMILVTEGDELVIKQMEVR